MATGVPIGSDVVEQPSVSVWPPWLSSSARPGPGTRSWRRRTRSSTCTPPYRLFVTRLDARMDGGARRRRPGRRRGRSRGQRQRACDCRRDDHGGATDPAQDQPPAFEVNLQARSPGGLGEGSNGLCVRALTPGLRCRCPSTARRGDVRAASGDDRGPDRRRRAGAHARATSTCLRRARRSASSTRTCYDLERERRAPSTQVRGAMGHGVRHDRRPRLHGPRARRAAVPRARSRRRPASSW